MSTVTAVTVDGACNHVAPSSKVDPANRCASSTSVAEDTCPMWWDVGR